MSVIRTVPKTSLYRETSVKFDFNYQIAGVYAGMYVCTDNKKLLMPINVNTFYLIDNYSICASIDEFVFVNSLDPDNLINIQLVHNIKNELISAQKIVISQFQKEKNISTHLESNRNNDGISARIFNRLFQVPETIGIDTISVTFSLAVYEVDGREYNEQFRSDNRG